MRTGGEQSQPSAGTKLWALKLKALASQERRGDRAERGIEDEHAQLCF